MPYIFNTQRCDGQLLPYPCKCVITHFLCRYMLLSCTGPIMYPMLWKMWCDLFPWRIYMLVDHKGRSFLKRVQKWRSESKPDAEWNSVTFCMHCVELLATILLKWMHACFHWKFHCHLNEMIDWLVGQSVKPKVYHYLINLCKCIACCCDGRIQSRFVIALFAHVSSRA